MVRKALVQGGNGSRITGLEMRQLDLLFVGRRRVDASNRPAYVVKQTAGRTDMANHDRFVH